MRNAKYLLSLFPGTVTLLGNAAGGWWVCSNIIFSLVVLAIAESFTGENTDNNFEESSSLPDMILYAHVVLQTLCISTLFYAIKFYQLSNVQILLAALSTGIHSGSSAIIIAHELIHRKEKHFQYLGKFLLLTSGNIYFYVNHLRVHHKWVGTMRDPATSRLGENVYKFFIRSASQQIVSSYKIEQARIKKQNKSFIYNYVVWNSFMVVVIIAMLFVFISWKAAVAFLIQMLLANFLLEYVNYIEHYGLVRKEDERVREMHSWQSDKVVSRFFLVDLSRHADHHYFASKHYHTLQTYDNSPKLPGGYVQMIYYALIPPIWFGATHKILRAQGYID